MSDDQLSFPYKVRAVPFLWKSYLITLFGQYGDSSLTNKRARITLFGQ